jgi:hypothetical protein
VLIRQTVTTLVTVAAMVFGAAPASSQPPSEFFGVDKAAPLVSPDTQVMADSGVTSVRFFLFWHQVEPSQGEFDWSQTDQIVGSLAVKGIRTVPFAYGTPDWLASQTADPPLSPEGMQAWREFLTAAVARYGPGGTYWNGGLFSPYHLQFPTDLFAPPMPITDWQIWNEPNFKNYWLPKPSASEYARLVEISHQAITAVDPSAQVVLAGMPGYVNLTAWRFLNQLYRVPGIKRDFDAAALHPYARSITQLRIELQRIRAVMTRNGDARTPLWITELGWGSGDRSASKLNKGMNGQKRLLSQAFELILDHRRTWNIGRLFWFSWRDGGPEFDTGNCNFCHTSGLLTQEGVPKPAWDAYRQYAGAG